MADFSLSRWLRLFIPRPRVASWRIVRAETFRLADVLERRRDTSGRFVYMVLADERRIYVGQCTRSLQRRIANHISARTQIGICIATMPIAELFIDVVHIDGDLRAAEIYYIRHFEPPYNQQHRGAP